MIGESFQYIANSSLFGYDLKNQINQEFVKAKSFCLSELRKTNNKMS